MCANELVNHKAATAPGCAVEEAPNSLKKGAGALHLSEQLCEEGLMRPRALIPVMDIWEKNIDSPLWLWSSSWLLGSGTPHCHNALSFLHTLWYKTALACILPLPFEWDPSYFPKYPLAPLYVQFHTRSASPILTCLACRWDAQSCTGEGNLASANKAQLSLIPSPVHVYSKEPPTFRPLLFPQAQLILANGPKNCWGRTTDSAWTGNMPAL